MVVAEADEKGVAITVTPSLNVHFPHFLLSVFLQFGNQLLVVSAHGALNGFVSLQSLQRLLTRTIVGIAENLCELLRAEFFWLLTEALYEFVGPASLLSGITQFRCRQ